MCVGPGRKNIYAKMGHCSLRKGMAPLAERMLQSDPDSSLGLVASGIITLALGVNT